MLEAIQEAHGIDKPVWLSETNAMPSDDRQTPCWQQHADDPYRTTLQEQAAFGVQAFALAAAAGYQRIAFYKMVDDHPCQQSSLWGLFRDDGTPRPVATALGAAIHSFSGFSRARFVPLARNTERWSSPYVPNWRVYQVVFDRPGNERVTVLWNGDATPLHVRPPAHAADVVDLTTGSVRPLGDSIDLPGATATFHITDAIRDPDGYHYIGGQPVLILEHGIVPNTPVDPPSLL